MKKTGLYIILLSAEVVFAYAPSAAQIRPRLSVSMEGGYAGNLYADSFGIDNTYLYSAAAASIYHSGKISLSCGYGLGYLEYDTNDIINNFIHMFTVSAFDRRVKRKIRWGLAANAAVKDYADDSSMFNSNKFLLKSDISYYLNSSLQIRGSYDLVISEYTEYDVLKNIEHRIQLDLTKTFPTKTTLKAELSYGQRSFTSGNSTFNWIGSLLRVSQSVDSKTGMAISYHYRLASEDTRPLSSFYVISGVTQYWDPWDGGQFELSIKRILPLAMVSYFDLELWDRSFAYDEVMRSELPWIDGKTGRDDNGWALGLRLLRQFNFDNVPLQYLKLSLGSGYLSNGSSDEYYEYDDLLVTGKQELNII